MRRHDRPASLRDQVLGHTWGHAVVIVIWFQIMQVSSVPHMDLLGLTRPAVSLGHFV